MITAKQIEQEVRRLAREYPEAMYISPDEGFGGCYYEKGKVERGPEQPGCLIGQALRNLKPGLKLDNGDQSDSIENLAYGLTMEEFELPNDLLNWLSHVQRAQDRGVTWGKAVNYADAELMKKN